jgi:hypothetical protein
LDAERTSVKIGELDYVLEYTPFVHQNDFRTQLERFLVTNGIVSTLHADLIFTPRGNDADSH